MACTVCGLIGSCYGCWHDTPSTAPRTFTTRDRDGRIAYVYPDHAVVLQRDGIPSWPWTAYGVGGYIATASTRAWLLHLIGITN